MKWIETPKHLETIDATEGMYPSKMTALKEAAEILEPNATICGYVHKGKWKITTKNFSSVVGPKSFFSAPDIVKFELLEPDAEALAVAITRFGYHGFELIGQREKYGRMSYIDGCSDSLLVFPNRMGDMSLNHLHFPPGINQTQHIHPSIRFGIVAGGKGEAWYQGATFIDQEGKDHKLKDGWVKPLLPGGIFLLEEQEQHSFRTYQDEMDVIAFHPEGNWGPTDENHPMLNKTLINHGKK